MRSWQPRLAVLAGIVGLICRRPALVHAMWLLVLLKLVTPPLVSIPVFSPAPLAEEQEAPRDRAILVSSDTRPKEPERPASEEVEETESAEEEKSSDEIDAEPSLPANEEEVAAAPVHETWRMPGEWFNALAWVWVIGSLSWFALASRRVWRFSRALRHARPALALQARVARLASRIGLARCPRVLIMPGRLSPLVWGFGRPVLVLPEGLETQVGDGGLDTLLLHELAHIHRRDHWVRWLDFLALGLFWWNPIAWYARREMREAEEQCCDAWVVRTLPGTGRAYATALVDAIDFLCAASPTLPPLASGLGQVADLKRRLTMILRGNTPAKLGRSYGLMVFGLALLLLPLVPVWGQVPKGPDDVRKRAIVTDVDQEVAQREADLKLLHAEIERKAAELTALKAKLTALAQKTTAEALKKKVLIDLLARKQLEKAGAG